MNKDWKIEQLHQIFSALGYPHHHGKRFYLDGELCTINEIGVWQPPFSAHHPGKVLEIDATDTHGNKREIRLYTSDWPVEQRK